LGVKPVASTRPAIAAPAENCNGARRVRAAIMEAASGASCRDIMGPGERGILPLQQNPTFSTYMSIAISLSM